MKCKCVLERQSQGCLETLLILVHYVREDRGMGAWAFEDFQL